jgi:hypothetical protein
MKKRKAIIDDGFNPELVRGARFDGIFEFPRIDVPRQILVPAGLTPWTKRNRAPGNCEMLEFFEKDVDFAEVLIQPDRYIDDIVSFPIFTPLDCSLYRDAPLAAQVANIYRSRAIGAYYQRKGANVYPLVRWGDERTYTTCLFPERIAFAGIPRHSPVVVSSYGCFSGKQNQFHFKAGLMAMLDELSPSMVIIHGPLSPDLGERLRRRTKLYQYPDWIARMKGRD